MSLQISLKQTNTVETNPTDGSPIYQVKSEIEASTEVTLHLFVIKLGTTEAADVFSHIAMPNDLTAYGEDRAAAVTAQATHYRTSKCTLQFTTAKAGADFALIVRQRLSSLMTAQPTVEASFTGETSYTITGA